MRRLTVVRTPWFSILLHLYTGAPDDSQTMHSHPWSFVSFLLRGSYVERRLRHRGILLQLVRWVNVVPATVYHTVRTAPGTISLLVTGPARRRVSKITRR